MLAPGGCDLPASTPTARTGSCSAVGFRNEYDAAFNRDGDLFTYDADMEWDINTPWYRPTRVCHVDQRQRVRLAQRRGQVAGLLPRQPAAVVNIGPGSPTGVTLRLRREVPGEVSGRALHLRLELRQALRRPPEARRQRATRPSCEEFVTGTPLPLTDLVVNPKDGAMYFADRRPEDAVGPLPRDLRRQGIDRAGEAGRAADRRSSQNFATSSNRSTARPTSRT